MEDGECGKRTNINISFRNHNCFVLKILQFCCAGICESLGYEREFIQILRCMCSVKGRSGNEFWLVAVNGVNSNNQCWGWEIFPSSVIDFLS